jgi:hypothetical protein
VLSASLNKFADFNEYRTDDGYVYVRVRAISSRVNKNHDGWPSDELQRAYRTFIGKPIFVDHHNSDPKKARGVIVDAALHVEDDTKTSSLDPYYASEGVDPAHLPPTWIELLLEVDAKKFPRLAKAVVSGDIDGVSMGANVEYSVCSHCGNTAHTPEEFCKHVLSKGAYFDYKLPNGLKIAKKAYENCHKIGFFEISFVFDPADETALTSEVITERRAKIAAILKEGTDLYDQENPPEDEIAVLEQEPEEQWGVAPQDEFQQVVAWRYEQLLKMGYPEELARQIAEQEYRGEGKGMDIHQLRDMIGQGATPEQAHSILARTANKYIKERDGKWVIIQKGTGKVLSEHDSEEKANASFRAMEMHKHEGSVKTAEDRRNPLPQNMMTSAPDEVNTLRKEQQCPICGSDMEDGVCEVCNYDEPPEGMDNPDLEKAKETDKQNEEQMAQQAAPPPGGEAPPGGAQPPTMPGAPAATGSPALASFFSLTPLVMGEKTSATNNSGRINTQERPILPATRQLSDKPIDQKVIQEAKKPVESKTKDTMTQTQKTAEGVEPGDPSFKADKRVDVLGIGGVDSDTDAEKQVDVLGVGAVTGDPLSDIEHENVEKDTGNFTAPHTDTWSGGEGDSLGQQEPVTSETGDFFTVSSVVKQHGDKFVVVEKGTGKVLSSHDTHEAAQKEADSSKDLGGPMGEGIGGAGAKDGGPTWDKSDNGFPDHDPSRVDLAAPLAEEIGAGTMTDPNEEFRSLKHAEPITNEGANDLGGPIGTAIAKAKAIQLKAFKLAETEIELGITDHEAKYDRVAELEGHSEDALDAQLATLSKVKTAGLRKSAAPTTQKTAGRMPSLRPVVAASGIEIEAHAVSDQEIEDSLW